MAELWLLLAVVAGSAGFAVLATATPGWLMGPLLWLATSLASAGVLLLLAIVDEDGSVQTPLGVVVIVCGALAIGVSARARPRRSVGPALLAGTLGALTPFLVAFTVVWGSCGSAPCFD